MKEIETTLRPLASAEDRFQRNLVSVIIPAYNPGAPLVDLVDKLLGLRFTSIIVVDDGSETSSLPIFDSLAERTGCVVLRHAVNCGKGRALKTAFNHCFLTLADSVGVITVDADGQHAAEDCGRVADALVQNPGKLILGVRQFGGDIPLRSRIGNTVTRTIFRFLAGRAVEDTQTGLRAIPRPALPQLISIPGERYEYEMNMLVSSGRLGLDIVQVPIQTLYFDGNRSSHFDPLTDSMRIYFVLVRFFSSSLVASAVDFITFAAIFWITSSLLASLLGARFIFGSLVNFVLNRSFVFHSRGDTKIALAKYYVLVVANVSFAYVAMSFLTSRLGMNVLVSKIIVEAPLSLVSFAIQRVWIFPHPVAAAE